MRKMQMQSHPAILFLIDSSPIHPMSPSPAAEDDAWGTTAASSSCFAVAWRVWILCLLHVVLAFSSVAVAAAVVVLLPFACMAASLCLVCASAALLVAPADGEAERGGSNNDDASSGEEEDHEGEAELEISYFQECTAAYADGAQFTDPRGDEQGQFFWVDAGSYYCYKKFYDLLAFWRRKETAGWR